jgi:putative transposase
MLVLEFRVYGKSQQFIAIEEAIRTVQFIRNKCIRLWMDNPKTNKYDLSKYSAVLAKEFPFANKLNAMSRQASAERAWAAISRFFDNCKKRCALVGSPDVKSATRQKVAGKKGFPSFQKDNRSIEYKTQSWKLADDRKSITFTDKNGIGK